MNVMEKMNGNGPFLQNEFGGLEPETEEPKSKFVVSIRLTTDLALGLWFFHFLDIFIGGWH